MTSIDGQQRARLSHPRLWLFIFTLIFSLPILGLGFYRFIDWNQHWYFVKQNPLEIKAQWPIAVKAREDTKVIVKEDLPQYPGEIDTPIKKYVCDKFGVYDCKIALGIIQAESGFNEQAWHINDNGTIDVGLWQVNSIHFEQAGCSLKEVLDPIRATDCAYNIYKASGNKWHAWSTFVNGAYLAQMK